MSAAQTFHPGERAMQGRVGLATRMAVIGPLAIRPAMPDEHREFYETLPLVFVGQVDGQGRPRAMVVAGPPGFVCSPDPTHLVFRTRDLAVRVGDSLGVLGLEAHTRRRNRVNGVVESVHAEGFTMVVRQSFGNCPKYIQARRASWAEAPATAQGAIHRGRRLHARAVEMLAKCDTFFIASAYPSVGDGGDAAHGVDVSHRGGRPGFVRIEQEGDEDVLSVPDFSGNFFFNTLGNLLIHPHAGLLVIDYDNGDLLQVELRAEIVEEGDEPLVFAGAKRILRLFVRSFELRPAALSMQWGPAELSASLSHTGAW